MVVILPATARGADSDPLPRTVPREPAKALEAFEAQDGFGMELLAAEPLVTDPVAMAYDENGRAYVVEMSDYPYTDKETHAAWKENVTDRPIGRVRILEDMDGDGDFDKGTIFAEKLSWPTGVAVWKGGVFVTATPDIWYFKDTDGDRRADIARKVYTGFRKFNVQAVMNNPIWGLDNRFYVAGGGNGGKITRTDAPDAPDAKPVTLSYNDFRFDPVGGELQPLAGGQRFGNTFDDWGNRFICNIRNPVIHVVMDSRYLARNPYLPVRTVLHDAAAAGDQLPVYQISGPEPWRALRAAQWANDTGLPRSERTADGFFTSTSGITVYRGAAYGPGYANQVFVGEVASNVIHRQALTPDGVTFKAQRVDSKTEFVRSTDNWFRPVNLVNAPDGTLHVLDMYRETIEHPWSIPDEIREKLDLESGRDRGRIYRLAPPGFSPPAPPRLGSATMEQLVAALENPNAWWRETAHRLIFERQDSAAVAPLRQMLHGSKNTLARLHAIWSLHGLNALDDSDIMHGLGDSAEGVREHAIRLAEDRLAHPGASPRLLDGVLAMAQDPSVRVRYQAALTLGQMRDDRVPAALAAIAQRDGADPWVRTAVISSAAESCDRLLVQLAATGRTEHIELLRNLAVVVGARNRPDELSRVTAAVAVRGTIAQPLRRDIVLGLGEGLKRSGGSLRSVATDNPEIATVLDDVHRTATDPAAPLADRTAAVTALRYEEFVRAQPVLASLLDSRQPADLQLAAVRTLNSFSHASVATLLIDRWPSYTPAIRDEVLTALVARKASLIAMFDAVESRRIPAGQISPTRKQVLMRHPDATISSRAGSLFGADAAGSRSAVIDRYKTALSMRGDKARGLLVYQTACMVCHRLGGNGNEIGPDLATVRHRTPDELLVHILDPNREVSPDYVQYAVELTDGRAVTGIIASETATSLTLKRADGAAETVLRQNVAMITSIGVSLMPEGLEALIDVQAMADLLTFLLGG